MTPNEMYVCLEIFQMYSNFLFFLSFLFFILINKSSYFCVLNRLLLLQIDHFGSLENGTFKQRYLLNDQHWHKEGGPILFYTGNEGDITWFCNNTVNMHLKKKNL